jgi:hypothetical protein
LVDFSSSVRFGCLRFLKTEKVYQQIPEFRILAAGLKFGLVRWWMLLLPPPPPPPPPTTAAAEASIIHHGSP